MTAAVTENLAGAGGVLLFLPADDWSFDALARRGRRRIHDLDGRDLSRRTFRNIDGPSVKRRFRVVRSPWETEASPMRSIWRPARFAARACCRFAATFV
jgi:hypothetical protein